MYLPLWRCRSVCTACLLQ